MATVKKRNQIQKHRVIGFKQVDEKNKKEALVKATASLSLLISQYGMDFALWATRRAVEHTAKKKSLVIKKQKLQEEIDKIDKQL